MWLSVMSRPDQMKKQIDDISWKSMSLERVEL